MRGFLSSEVLHPMNQLENLCSHGIVWMCCAVEGCAFVAVCTGAAASAQPSWAVARREDLSWLTSRPDVQRVLAQGCQCFSDSSVLPTDGGKIQVSLVIS